MSLLYADCISDNGEAMGVPSPSYSCHPNPSELLIDTSASLPSYRPQESSLCTPRRVSETSGSTRPSSQSEPSRTLGTHFTYKVGSIKLDLDIFPRQTRSVPTYGRNGLVAGSVQLKQLSHVQSVVVTLSGRAHAINNQTGAAQRETKLCDVSQTIYSARNKDDEKTRTKKRKEPLTESFPFTITFPSTIKDSDQPLPPTFRADHPSMNGWIEYRLKIKVFRTGLWPREALTKIIHYLPRFHAPPQPLLAPTVSLMDAKRFGFESDKWKSSQAQFLKPPNLSSTSPKCPPIFRHLASYTPELRVYIPNTAQVVARTEFPVNICIRVPDLSSSSPSLSSQDILDRYVKGTTVQLVRIVTVYVGRCKSSHYIGLGTFRQQQIEEELVRADERIIRGWIKGGIQEGEATWSLKEIAGVEYAIRVTVALEEGKHVIFRHEEPVHMFTHPEARFGDASLLEGAADEPAVHLGFSTIY